MSEVDLGHADDHGQLIDGIRWRTRTGTPWRDVPERYGPWGRGGLTTKLHLAVEQGRSPCRS
ncbi:transposase [Nonomuraea sp. CA-141351]|uniref:transposase n=1 Tax=Nonomuraea sp. CA-141351 TaxID=3239996 RepID=UPI003D91799D